MRTCTDSLKTKVSKFKTGETKRKRTNSSCIGSVLQPTDNLIVPQKVTSERVEGEREHLQQLNKEAEEEGEAAHI